MTALDWYERDQLFIADSGRWGRGYGGKPFASAELDETLGYITDARAAGYGQPGYGLRHTVSTPGFRETEHGFLLPNGYDAMNHPDRMGVDPSLLEPDTPTSTPSAEDPWQVPDNLQQYYRSCGWKLDQNGRPCNPHGPQLVGDTRIGLNTNLGSGFEAGETIMVDVVVEDGDSVLFNTRQDMGQTIPSLVGGYSRPIDYGVNIMEWRAGNRPITQDGIYWAARRIVETKTGVALPPMVEADYAIVWGARLADERHTWSFWTLTYTVRIRLERGWSRFLVPRLGTDGEPMGVWHEKRNIASVVKQLRPDHRHDYEATTA